MEPAVSRCPGCRGRGTIEITGCPWEQITPDVLEALAAARRIEKGCWPVAGGWLDQTQKCLDAIELIEDEQAEWKRRK